MFLHSEERGLMRTRWRKGRLINIRGWWWDMNKYYWGFTDITPERRRPPKPLTRCLLRGISYRIYGVPPKVATNLGCCRWSLVCYECEFRVVGSKILGHAPLI